ncbi:hypothetical protein [Streptomyces sp. NPDC048428]|uniref:hypothetical protein n=1 Tax=Streptomyces sp. NPDC048428 TaxID=3154503 RepID=UPI003417D0B7
MPNKLARGMGSSFKPCERRGPSGRPHLCAIRFRNTRGKQAEQSGFPTQDAAIERLTELCTARRATPRSIAEQQEILGEMAFDEYAKAWFARKHGLTGSTKAASESRMRSHPCLEIGSRRMHTLDSFVVEASSLPWNAATSAPRPGHCLPAGEGNPLRTHTGAE